MERWNGAGKNLWRKLRGRSKDAGGKPGRVESHVKAAGIQGGNGLLHDMSLS